MASESQRRLDVGALQVESFDTSVEQAPYEALVWGSRNTQCDISACNSQQITACESTTYGSCASYWPNCDVSLGCPV